MAVNVELSQLGNNKVKISSTDITGDYLINKLVAGTGITLTQEHIGGNEDIKISENPSTSGFVPYDYHNSSNPQNLDLGLHSITASTANITGGYVNITPDTGTVSSVGNNTITNNFGTCSGDHLMAYGMSNTICGCCNSHISIFGQNNSSFCPYNVIVGDGITSSCCCTSIFGSLYSGCISITNNCVNFPDGSYFCSGCYSGHACTAEIACCACCLAPGAVVLTACCACQAYCACVASNLCGFICCANLCCSIDACCCFGMNNLFGLNFACWPSTCSCVCCQTPFLFWDTNVFKVHIGGGTIKTILMA